MDVVRLGYVLGYGPTYTAMVKAVYRIRSGMLPPWDKFLLLGHLAGLPEKAIAVLFAMLSLPDEAAELRRHVGITSGLRRKKKSQDWVDQELRRSLQRVLRAIPDGR
jgi:hypothetical protein